MKIVKQEEFKDTIKEGVVLVDFFATWCGPCRMMGAVLEDIAKDLEGQATVVKVDVDESGDLAREFGVMSIPTLIIFKNGVEQEKHIGLWQQNDCVKAVRNYL